MTPEQIQRAWSEGRILPLASPAPHDQQALQQAIGSRGLDWLASRWGPGVVLGSGGSSGAEGSGRRWCLQPLAHLEASAAEYALSRRGVPDPHTGTDAAPVSLASWNLRIRAGNTWELARSKLSPGP